MNSIIETKNLGFRTGSRFVLQDISLNIKKGEHWFLFGQNGSGKSTLMSILAGYRANTHGSLRLFSQIPNEDNILNMRKRIGLLSSSFFDSYYKNEDALTIALSGFASGLGINNELTTANIVLTKQLLRNLGLGRKMYYPYKFLSKGERQCVLLTKTLINKPEVLLLDEPCSSLDLVAKNRLLDAISIYAKNDALTILYVTHTVEEILPEFDNCLILSHGKIAACGKTTDVFTSEILSRMLNTPIEITWHDMRYHVKTSTSQCLQNIYTS